MESIIQTQVEQHLIKPDGNFPNNPELPVLHYRSAFSTEKNLGDMMEKTFRHHHWKNAWRNGIYDYHHYHSTAHEVLGVYMGDCKVQLGGPDGIILELIKGDVIVLPAGVAHKNIGSGDDFKCIGAYPKGQDYDMNYGKAEELEKAVKNISRVPLPELDPVYGTEGQLLEYWKVAKVSE